MSEPVARPIVAAAGWDCHLHVFDPRYPVVAGHYRPQIASLETIEALSHPLGIGHLVLIQPSVYGEDNQVMLEALLRSNGRHRGVAVVSPDISDEHLLRMHHAGVRGVRFNLVSPVGRRPQPLDDLKALGPRLAALGWHVQWYVDARQLPDLIEAGLGTTPPFVLDHLGGLHAGLSPHDEAWRAMQTLADQGAWVKLSGWYRLGDTMPYRRLFPAIRRLAGWFGERLLWGSDWPHTSFAAGTAPAYSSTWQPLLDTLPAETTNAIQTEWPARLYA